MTVNIRTNLIHFICATVYSNWKVTSLYYLTELQGQFVFCAQTANSYNNVLLSLNQNTCNQRTGVAESERRTTSYYSWEDSECQQVSSYDSEQRWEPTEDPEWAPPDPNQDPVPVSAGHEESGEHLQGWCESLLHKKCLCAFHHCCCHYW